MNQKVEQLLPARMLLPDEVLQLETRPNYLAFAGVPLAAGLMALVFPVLWVIVIVIVMMSFLSWKNAIYAMTNKRVLLLGGILSRECKQCPLGKIQNFEYKKYPFSRRGNISFDTAGTGAKEIVWKYIDNVEDVYHKISSIVHK